MKTHSYRWLLSSACSLFIVISGAGAKDKKAKTPDSPKDEIQVVGHVDLTGGAVTNFLVTQHYSSAYLYAERGSGQPVILLDVTKPDKPAVLGNMAYAANGGQNLMLVAGTAALAANTPVAQAPAALSQTIRIMDFSDPKNPKVAREFTGVTAIARDDQRRLVFLGDGSGIWILRQRLAMDPEIEKAYENYVNYYR